MPRWLLLWLLVCIGAGTYFLLRSSPAAASIPFLPEVIAAWCDRHYDLRTLVLVFGVCVVPSLVLRNTDFDRWLVEGGLAIFFLGAEVAQIWIPYRSFSWWDMGYSVLGILLAEGLAQVVLRLTPERVVVVPAGDETDSETLK